MKKLSLYVFLVLMFSLNINVLAWEKVPVPDSVDKKTKSPWNFFDNFEDQKLGKYRINNKGTGKKPFKFKKDPDGNTYIEVTVKHGWNKGGKTERAEFGARPKRTLNKEIWIGFKMRLPKDFIHINDRVLFFQFKNQHDPMKKSPLLGIRFYQNGDLLDISGDTGGNAAKSYNKKEAFKHRISIKYKKVSNFWYAKSEKNRSEEYENLYLPEDYIFFKLKKKGNLIFKLTPNKSFKVTNLGEWTTYKIGIHNSRKEDGFVKVYKDDQLIMNYEGITYDWNGNYTGSHIRIGPYRDSDPEKKGYPPQSIHYDDFIVVSDKKTLDQYLK